MQCPNPTINSQSLFCRLSWLQIESHTQAHKIPENKLEHEVFTVETEQCLEQTQRDHAQLQREGKKKQCNFSHSTFPGIYCFFNAKSTALTKQCLFYLCVAYVKLTRELLLMRVSSVSRMVSLSWRCNRMKRRKVLRREVSVILRKNKSRYAVLAIISSTDDWHGNHERERERRNQNKRKWILFKTLFYNKWIWKLQSMPNMAHIFSPVQCGSPCAERGPWLEPGSRCGGSQEVGSAQEGVPPVLQRYRIQDCSWKALERRHPSSPPSAGCASRHPVPQSSLAGMNTVHSALSLAPGKQNNGCQHYFMKFTNFKHKLNENTFAICTSENTKQMKPIHLISCNKSIWLMNYISCK